jgi:hypothetical protein
MARNTGQPEPMLHDRFRWEGEGRAIAFHEAGHAVLAWYLGRTIERVRLEVDAGRGLTETSAPAQMTAEDLHQEAMILLGGGEAEFRFAPHRRGCSRGARFDWSRALRLIRESLDIKIKTPDRRWLDREAEFIESRLAGEVRTLFEGPRLWQAVKAAAEALLQDGILSGPRAEAIIRTALEG